MALDRNSVISEAQKFIAKGQFDKAIAEWKKLLKESPNDPNIYNTIGDLSLKKNSKAEAVDAYTRAADMLASDGFSSKAIALYKKVLNIDPKKIEPHLALANLNAEKGLTGNALESYKIVADHYTQKKETVKALGIYQKMADLNASNVAFRLKVADMYAKEGMNKEAVAAFLQAADVHISKDAFKEARQLFERALALDANNKDVYHRAGLVYFKEGKFVEACKALKPAFEADSSKIELAELYLNALSKAGRGDEAEAAYQKLVAARPDNTELREKLYRFYLERKEHDKAFSEVSSLANIRIESNDLDGAEELLRGFLEEAPRSIEGRRALSALYKTVGKTQEAASALVQAAEILIEDGDSDGARTVLARAVELAPEHDEAQRLMQTLKPVLQPEPDLPSMEEPAPEMPEPAEPAPVASRAASKKESVALLEDPVIAEALAEVDVLVKYGLSTKAIEQLEKLVTTNPKNLQIRIRLRDLYGDQGNMRKAVAHMLVLADLYLEHGMQEKADEILEAAHGMDPSNAGIQARTGTIEPAAAAGAEAPVLDDGLLALSEEPLGDLDPATETLGELSFGEPQEPAPDEPALAVSEPDDIVFDQPFTAPDPPADQQAPDAEPAVIPDFGESFEPPVEPPSFAESAGPPGNTADMAAVTSSEPVEQAVDLSEIWAEAEFYYQQGLFDEARKHYEKIVEVNPDSGPAHARLAELSKEQEQMQEFSKLADAVDGLEGLDGAGYAGEAAATAPADMNVSASDEEAVRSLMQEIAQLKQKPAAPGQQPPAAGKVPPAQTVETASASADRAVKPAPSSDEDFFDLGEELNNGAAETSAGAQKDGGGADDFFDLASELRDELSSVSIPSAASVPVEEQSLDDIFEEFKKGVEQQAVKEDADTHYNLGVAYKEMGLLDDAIGEFVMTPEDEPKYVQSRYMLGLCYMEKGDYQNAIIEMRLAQATAEQQGRPVGDCISIGYDLGLAFQGAGDAGDALGEFQKVHAIDPSYRDAADKIRELQRGSNISLAQLKTDIQKEVSSKFLEEGERIEREEKTKKSEKSPSLNR